MRGFPTALSRGSRHGGLCGLCFRCALWSLAILLFACGLASRAQKSQVLIPIRFVFALVDIVAGDYVDIFAVGETMEVSYGSHTPALNHSARSPFGRAIAHGNYTPCY